jgi:hypothetical protein
MKIRICDVTELVFKCGDDFAVLLVDVSKNVVI